jgi:hypothetical protein
MAKKKAARLGKLPPRYSFILNPYEDLRCSTCAKCEKATYPRKFTLQVDVEGYGPFVLGKTCKYCSKCEIIIAHKDELEAILAAQFSRLEPEVIGNDYEVLATVDTRFWNAGMKEPPTIDETLEHTADIKKYLDLHYRPAGRYPADEP